MKEHYKENLVKTYSFFQNLKACISASVKPGFHLAGAQLETDKRHSFIDIPT